MFCCVTVTFVSRTATRVSGASSNNMFYDGQKGKTVHMEDLILRDVHGM